MGRLSRGHARSDLARDARGPAALGAGPALSVAAGAPLQVSILLFAVYRDLAGAGECTVTVPAGATAGDAVAALRARGDGFAQLPAAPVVAVNREFAPLHTVLQAGDELALLPPVAGG